MTQYVRATRQIAPWGDDVLVCDACGQSVYNFTLRRGTGFAPSCEETPADALARHHRECSAPIASLGIDDTTEKMHAAGMRPTDSGADLRAFDARREPGVRESARRPPVGSTPPPRAALTLPRAPLAAARAKRALSPPTRRRRAVCLLGMVPLGSSDSDDADE